MADQNEALSQLNASQGLTAEEIDEIQNRPFIVVLEPVLADLLTLFHVKCYSTISRACAGEAARPRPKPTPKRALCY
jgi:hypothetical protein